MTSSSTIQGGAEIEGAQIFKKITRRFLSTAAALIMPIFQHLSVPFLVGEKTQIATVSGLFCRFSDLLRLCSAG